VALPSPASSPDERGDRDELRPIFSRPAEAGPPRLRPGHTENWTLHHLSDRLRMKGWLVPADPLPDALSDRTVQRIVVRDGLSGDLADRLLHDIATGTAYLDELVSPMPAARQHPSFHH
jgi:glutamate decarboxylase